MIGEPAADEVERLLDDGDAGIASINLAEAIDVAMRVHGVPESRVSTELAELTQSSLVVVDCDHARAVRAGELRARHYKSRTRAISIADCVLLASAGSDDTIATADGSVLEVARAEGIDVVALVDSTGRRSG